LFQRRQRIERQDRRLLDAYQAEVFNLTELQSRRQKPSSELQQIEQGIRRLASVRRCLTAGFDFDSHNCSMYPAMMIGWNWATSIQWPWRQAQNRRTASAYARSVFLFRIAAMKNPMNRRRR
jgi:hypothetical protein